MDSRILRVLCLVLLLCLAVAGTAWGEQLDVVFTGDINGWVSPHPS